MRILAWAGFVGVALLAVAFGVGILLARRYETVARASAPSDPETRFLQTRSGRVHLLDLGEGDVILLVHGTGRSVADLQQISHSALMAALVLI